MVMPLPLSSSRWSRARWLVIAPHPDDETLGAGALIAETVRSSRLIGLVYLTDGTGSHPSGTVGLAAARRREAREALRRLGGHRVRIDHLGWKDAHPHMAGSIVFRRDAQRLGAWLRDRQIDAVAVSDWQEQHCDHVAAWHLARAAIRQARRAVGLFSYHVWGKPPAGAIRRYRTAAMPPARRLHALRAHRSQLSPIFGEGFRLDPNTCRMPRTDCLTLRRS